MKSILSFVSLFFVIYIYGQNNYKQIPSEKLSEQKIQLTKNFIQTYLTKCENKNYTEFSNFNLATEHKKFMDKNLTEICQNDEKNFGKINLNKFNSAYKNKSSLVGGNELYIFDANTEKDKNIKYLSVWISKENQIDGMVITDYKPLKKRK